MTDESTGLTPEDARIIAAAANSGQIGPDNIDVWCNAVRADREGTRRVLASLPKAWTSTVAAAKPVTIKAANEPTVRGGGATPPPPPPPGRVDAFGFPVGDIPAPVVLSKGKDPQTWTKEENYRQFAHMLGGKFAIGVPRPPRANDSLYFPSPNDHSELVNGEWVEKRPYKEI